MLNRPTLKNESTFIDFLEFIKIVHNVYINQIKCGGWTDVHVFLLKSTSLGPAQFVVLLNMLVQDQNSRACSSRTL
jgi:hypothetical protein